VKRLLGSLLLGPLVLAGCGDASSSGTALDGCKDTASCAGSSSPIPSSPVPSASASQVDGAVTVAIVSQTAAGGHVMDHPVRLDDQAARAKFLAPFRGKGLDVKVRQAIASATVPSGDVLLGAVVAIGCDVPPAVDVGYLGTEGYVITPHPVDKPLQECLAPVTSVAIVAVPA
jgi:hypothetical protein